MLASMTGFGKAVQKVASGLLQIEIQAVNSRYLIIKTALPKSYASLDLAIKKALSEKIERGTLFVNVTLSVIDKEVFQINTNFELAKSYQIQIKKLATELKLRVRDEEIMAYLLKQTNLIESVDESKPSEKQLFQILDKALDELMQTKKREGCYLAKDILKRLKKIQMHSRGLKVYEKKQPQKVADKIHSTFRDLQQGFAEERFVKEIALLADKAAISEEIARLHSHIDHMRHLIVQPERASGKKLEFFTAELFRETNTISQKALFQEMVQHCIEMKSEIEKIKEQLANVE